jgi:hypothetical protein
MFLGQTLLEQTFLEQRHDHRGNGRTKILEQNILEQKYQDRT